MAMLICDDNYAVVDLTGSSQKMVAVCSLLERAEERRMMRSG
jgi:hypothetical protein